MTHEIENREDLLESWLRFRDIKLVLWDLDDTILNTVVEFTGQMDKYIDSINSQLPQHSKDDLWQLLRKTNNEAYKTSAVSPKRWIEVAKNMAKSLNVDEDVLNKGLPILMEIYETAPEFLEGSEDALKTFKKMGLPMGLVTHATEEWTKIKIEERGLQKYFDEIHIVNETKFKEAEDWKKAIDSFGVDPKNVLVLGDNLTGDICAVHSIGVGKIVYFPGLWSVYSSGEIPQGTIVIEKGIKALIDTLISSN